MNKAVEAWENRPGMSAYLCDGDMLDDVLNMCDALAAEVERLEKALKTISECSDLKEIYRIARGE